MSQTQRVEPSEPVKEESKSKEELFNGDEDLQLTRHMPSKAKTQRTTNQN